MKRFSLVTLLVAFLASIVAASAAGQPLRIFIRSGPQSHGPGAHDSLASGNTAPCVGTTDIVMFPSIVDVSGINRVSPRRVREVAGVLDITMTEWADELRALGGRGAHQCHLRVNFGEHASVLGSVQRTGNRRVALMALKRTNKAPEPTAGSITPRAIVRVIESKPQNVNRHAARGARAALAAHL